MMDKKTVGDIAVLAALSLTDEEKEQVWEDMSRMVSFFDRLKQADGHLPVGVQLCAGYKKRIFC